MNYKMVGFVLGRIFLIEAALMLFPMGCAAIYGEWASIPAFLIPVVILLVLGLAASLKSPKDTKIYARDGLAIVALVWVPRHPVLAQLFPLDRRHGRSCFCDGGAAHDGRPRHAPDAR